MNTKIIFAMVVVGILLTGVGAATLLPVPDEVKDKGKAPENVQVIKAVEDGVWVRMPNGMERMVTVHYIDQDCDKNQHRDKDRDRINRSKVSPAKPDWVDDKKDKDGCYDFLGKGVLWKKMPVSYVIHPDLNADAVFASAETWDEETNVELFNNIYSSDYDANYDVDSPDGRNELSFGDYEQDGVIAVAVVWAFYTGKPANREIFEFDVMLDTDFWWSDQKSPGLMDIQNIATHELGHGLGLADIYSDSCDFVTMYYGSSSGEITKRTLTTHDITALHLLYGE